MEKSDNEKWNKNTTSCKLTFFWSAIRQQLCIFGRSFEVREMVKEALRKVESVRVTSSGFGMISCVSEEQKERALFFGAGYR